MPQQPPVDHHPADLGVADHPLGREPQGPDRMRQTSPAGAGDRTGQQLDQHQDQHREHDHQRPRAEHRPDRGAGQAAVDLPDDQSRCRLTEQHRDERAGPPPPFDPEQPAQDEHGQDDDQDPE
jgi:hypothetical protein